MKSRIFHLWDAVNSSLWFIPALMTVVTVAVSFATITFDGLIKEKLVDRTGWIWAGGPEGAREILSTIAGSMITVAGVVFSITVVVLALASSQFGPRLLRNFMRDRGNQIVLGTFISTFTYCLLILRTIRGEDGGSEFVPHISVTLGIVFALASLGVLIYFIHHVSVSIQAPIIIARVAEELDRAVDRLFPELLGQSAEEEIESARRNDIPPELDRDAGRVPSCTSGYLQAIDSEGLMDLATENDLLIHINVRPGEFIVTGSDLVLTWPKQIIDDTLADQVNALFIFGAERTEAQDIGFSVNQLAEIAVRALSPGINDPFTAMTCVDRLGAALCRLAERKVPSPYRHDANGTLRVIAKGTTFTDLADDAFNPIRQYGRSSALVTIRLLKILAVVAEHVRTEEDRQALLRHALMIERASREALAEPAERDAIEDRYWGVLKVLGQDRSVPESIGGSGGFRSIIEQES
jgi:uncharacterized membrane protein